MNKLKTSKSVYKRFSITSAGKFMRHKTSRSHLLQKKTSKRKQKLRHVINVSKSDLLSIKEKLPYIL